MKPTLTIVLLRCLPRKPQTGFTLLELTVVVAISSILAAIALPTFLNQANRAKQVEAEAFVGALNRAQQAHFLVHSQFATDFTQLGVQPRQGPNYRFLIEPPTAGDTVAVQRADSLRPQLRPYVGAAALVQTNTGEPAVQTLLCESDSTSGPAPRPQLAASTLTCAPGTRGVSN